MVIILISSNMVTGRAGYRGTNGVMVLIATNSDECRVLNVYRGVLSIREKTHESDEGARVWWCER